jgi:hypothetical protein
LPSIVRVTRPSRPDKARRLGYKAKQVSRGNGCEARCSSQMRRGMYTFTINEFGNFSFVQDPAAGNKGHLVMVTFVCIREPGRSVWDRRDMQEVELLSRNAKSTSKSRHQCT